MKRWAVRRSAADSGPLATGDHNFRLQVTVTWELVD